MDGQTDVPITPLGAVPTHGPARQGRVLCFARAASRGQGFLSRSCFWGLRLDGGGAPLARPEAAPSAQGEEHAVRGNGEPGRAAPPLRRATSTLQVLSASMVRGGVSSFHTRMLLRGVCVFHDKQRPSRPRFRPAEQSTGSGRSLHSERSVRAQGSVRAL